LERNKNAFPFHQGWLDICCAFKSLMHSVKQLFHWVERFAKKVNSHLCWKL